MISKYDLKQTIKQGKEEVLYEEKSIINMQNSKNVVINNTTLVRNKVLKRF